MAVQTPPWPPSIETVDTRLISNVASPGFRSPLTGAQQRAARPGAVWQFHMRFVTLDDLSRRQWAAFLAYVQDEAATFYWGPYPLGRPYAYPSGTGWGASPKVNGANQTGRSLIVDGLSAFATFKAGDWLAFPNGTFRELHMIKTDVTANGSGQATIPIVPEIRISPADNADVFFDSNHANVATRCAGEFMLEGNNQAGFSASFDTTNEIQFTLREALAQ